MNVKLFNRTSRRVELTTAGKIFLNKAREIVNGADEACATMSSLSKGKSGYLAVAFNEASISTFLPEAIKQFTHKYPDVELALEESLILKQFNDLDEKRIDLGFTRPFGNDISAYSRRLALREKYVLALPVNHKLCTHSSLSLDMIQDEPLIIFPRAGHPHLRARFEESFQLAGLEPNIVREESSKHTTLALVAAGIGLSIEPESSIISSPAGVEFRKLDSNLPPVEIFALWLPENDSPLIQNFLDFIPAQT